MQILEIQLDIFGCANLDSPVLLPSLCSSIIRIVRLQGVLVRNQLSPLLLQVGAQRGARGEGRRAQRGRSAAQRLLASCKRRKIIQSTDQQTRRKLCAREFARAVARDSMARCLLSVLPGFAWLVQREARALPPQVRFVFSFFRASVPFASFSAYPGAPLCFILCVMCSVAFLRYVVLVL